MATEQDVAMIAIGAATQHQGGDTSWPVDGYTIHLEPGGMCARGVREVHEAAMGLGAFDWAYCAATARDMETLLRKAGTKIDSPVKGCVVAMNNQSYWAGHIGIYVGHTTAFDGSPECIVENTSSVSRGIPRGIPGTKLSPLSSVAGEISGYYAPLASGAPNLAKWGLLVRYDNQAILGIIPVAGLHRDTGRVYYQPVKAGSFDKYPVPQIEVGNLWGLAVSMGDAQIAGQVYAGAIDDDRGRVYVDVTTGPPQVVGNQVAS